MFQFRGCLAAAVGLLIAAHAGPARAAIVGGHVDDFEDGSTQSWSNGANSPNPVTNLATGGPAGLDDNYMHLASNGGTSGGKLVAFNSAQWAGDYLDAGVNAIRMHVNNQDNTNLVLRLILADFINGQSLSTIAPVNVPAGSGWTSVSFSLAQGNLTGGDYATAMANVGELNLLHSPNAVSSRQLAPNIVAQLGVDDITAVVVPEPGGVALAALGCAVTTLRVARPHGEPTEGFFHRAIRIGTLRETEP